MQNNKSPAYHGTRRTSAIKAGITKSSVPAFQRFLQQIRDGIISFAYEQFHNNDNNRVLVSVMRVILVSDRIKIQSGLTFV